LEVITMSSIIPQPHQFVRPGQVAPHLPAPDHCMMCGKSDAEHQAGGYMQEAEAQDQFLRDRLTVIRHQEENGDITTREAADLRIAAMEHLLAATRALRAEHFGG
jgi:hypothetical protein